jgi:hypothetical protein
VTVLIPLSYLLLLYQSGVGCTAQELDQCKLLLELAALCPRDQSAFGIMSCGASHHSDNLYLMSLENIYTSQAS